MKNSLYKNKSRGNKAPSFDFHKIFRTLLYLVPIGVAGNILFTLLKTDKSVFSELNQISIEYLSLAIALSFVPWLTNSIRVYIWTWFLKRPLRLYECLSIVIGSELGSSVSPTAIGGGYVKLGMLIQKGFKSGTAASLMVLGSLENTLFFAIAIPLTIVLSKAYQLKIIRDIYIRLLDKSQSVMIIGGLVIMIAALLFLLRKHITGMSWIRKIEAKIKQFITDFIHIYQMIGKRGRFLFLFTLLLTSIQWSCRYLVVSAFLASLHLPVYPVTYFLFQWLIFTAGTLIPTPGGSVGVETTFYLIYQSYIPAGYMGFATAVWRFLTYYLQLILGAVIFPCLYSKKKAMDELTDHTNLQLQFTQTGP